MDQFENRGLVEKTQGAEECVQQDFMFILFTDLYVIKS